jgi:3'-phosphoadenosine 5'-phosphosulfate sulfotransferase (PAPS reductase)/FAD synthetase
MGGQLTIFNNQPQGDPPVFDKNKVVGEIRDRLAEINIVSFSGGKDSSVVLDLVFEAVRDSGKRLLIITADTLMEIPYFSDYVAVIRGAA